MNAKIVLVGDSTVGKTTIVEQFCNNKFNDNTTITIGASFFTKTYELNGKIIKMQIWDTAGQERFKSLVPMYLRNADIVLFVFDVSKPETLNSIIYKWVGQAVMSFSDSHYAKFIIVGNKTDLMGDKNYKLTPDQNYEMSKTICDNFDIHYISAKNTEDVTELFDSVAKCFVKNFENKNRQLNEYIINRSKLIDELSKDNQNEEYDHCCY